MAKDRLDVSEFLKNDLMVENISKTRKILGVFEDELYCYLTEIPANTKAVCAYIEKINQEQEIGSVIVSEITDDKIQSLLVNYLSENNIKFRFVTNYNPKDDAYIVIIAKKDVQRDPIKFECNVPRDYLDKYGKFLCKKHMKELSQMDAFLAGKYKKESAFFSKGACAICREREPNKWT